MKTAPTGHYRKIIGDVFPMVRMAFTHTAMYGVTRVDDTNVIKMLEQSDDEYAEFYIDGLKSGRLVTIVETPSVDRYFSVGELYFKS